MKRILLFYGVLSFLLLACGDKSIEEPTTNKQETTSLPESLPLNPVDLTTLSLPANWQNAGDVSADMNVENDLQIEEGTGILVCQEKGEHLNLGIEHGDVELDIYCLVPKGSNSGLYFQGRYEVQILDSWKKEVVGSGDIGGIYANKTDEATGVDSGGSAPSTNAAKAPGLWQHFNILFRAPKFDENGIKTEDAKFEHVYLNGHLIQKDVALESPTIAAMLEGESATGPLMIQGDHGAVAFKAIKYKKMGTDTIAVSNINYALYQGHWDYIPNFEELTPDKTGTANSFMDLEDLAGQRDKFGIVFTADIDVPKDGDYLFTTIIDDGGDLYIDSTLVVHNQGEPGLGRERGMIHLSQGKHQLKLTYFEEVWLALAVVLAEGPEMPQKGIASFDLTKLWGQNSKKNKAIVSADKQPEIVRGFIDYKGGKKTHVLTVGDPSGVHYSYDLTDGALLKSWRGDFADVTNMWVNRGESQTMLPQNAAIDYTDGVPITTLNNRNAAWPSFRSSDYKNKGFRLDDAGRPTFLSSYKGVNIEDRIEPTNNNTLKRSIRFISDSTPSNQWYRIAVADKITKLPNGLYNVGGEYYLKFEEDSNVSIRNQDTNTELVAKTGKTLDYELIW